MSDTHYVVLTGDLKSSRKIKDRIKSQENLKHTLSLINRLFKDAVVAKFVVIGGDGFQGIIQSPSHIINIYYFLFENIEHPFYLGVGIGEIATRLSKNVTEMDGEAFHRAAAALIEAKREKKWIKLKGFREGNNIIESLLNLMANTMWNWTKREKEVVIDYRKMKINKAEVTLEDVASRLGIKKPTLSIIRKRSRYAWLEDAERAINDFVSRKWLTKR